MVTREELIENVRKHKKIIREARAKIIDDAISIEAMLDSILTQFFIENGDKQNIFQFDVLAREFFTFHQKIRIFSELGLHRDPKYKDKFKGLTGKLDYIKDMRNAVAHGLPFLGEPKILYFKQKQRTLELNNLEMQKFDETIDFVLDALSEVFDDILSIKKKTNS